MEPNYTLSSYLTELYPMLINYRTTPYLTTLQNYLFTWHSVIKNQQAQKLTAGVKMIPCPINYPCGGPGENFKKNSRKSLTVPTIDAQCRKLSHRAKNCRTLPIIPHCITLYNELICILSLYIEPNYTLSQYIEPNYTLSYYIEPNYTLS